MKVTGLDRIVVMVRDIDKALEFFSGKLGMEFRELAPEISERDGNRGFVCHETHLHLICPRLPLPEAAPLPMRRGAEMLAEKEAVILVMLFKVENPRGAVEELKQQGHEVLRSWENCQDYVSVGIGNLMEYLLDPKDTMGIPICLSNYDRV